MTDEPTSILFSLINGSAYVEGKTWPKRILLSFDLIAMGSIGTEAYSFSADGKLFSIKAPNGRATYHSLDQQEGNAGWFELLDGSPIKDPPLYR